jgi:hypothetical protein
MTIIHTVTPRTGDVRRSAYCLDAPAQGRRVGGGGLYARPVRSSRPSSMRPAGAPMRYRGTGVAMSAAPHRRRPVRLATTVGLALGAGLITLWLGLMAHVGQVANSETGNSAAHVPDRLAVVRVGPGESLQDVAARVAPDAPARQVADRIRELNDLSSSSLVAGETLIAPVG